ncbi:putative pyruvate decarboxylase [Mytilinidion resinicola]|uniref:Pyruvate decarboxylase n=1 Tax=Mytilinidion resinicola TaxID=574789 RepID=A0A6A6YQ57_9PEZI|nr:putative pyruvate decarboxylase [Mytilinidion resinicola]KAF2811022.1 putative pyruvate decarboxylase [Mytilinidion resinicola]
MTTTVPLASYLFTRLRQLGIGAVHGEPGDYTLRALDFIRPAGLRWIGNCNELNAGYAADGYARVKGMSAFCTTYGVGELSAINAVAGSYAEYSPVVHIVGCPARMVYGSNRLVHHALETGNMRVYADMYARVTAAQANLTDARTAPGLIDRVLEECRIQSRPVYIELPSDMVEAQVDESRLSAPLHIEPPTNARDLEDAVVNETLERIYSSKRPYILVDGLVRPDGIVDEVNELARVTGFPTLAITFGGGIINGSSENYHGVHAGKFGSIDHTPYTDSADLALLFGPLLSDTNTQGWSVVPKEDITISFRRNSIDIGSASHELRIKSFMRSLLSKLDPSKISAGAPNPPLSSPRDLLKSLPPPDPSAPVDQDTFYLRLSPFFRPYDIIICANGTPLVGGRDFILPPGARLVNSGVWLSVGHMLPAAQGIAVAQREALEAGQQPGRTILFEGDGSFQATAQELSTIIRYRLDVTIFIVNNDGYTFERLIHGLEEEYNDVAPWRYPEAPRFFGAPEDGSYAVETHDARNWGELLKVLESESFGDGKGLKMVNVWMRREDVTRNFKAALVLAGKQLLAGSE